MSKLITIKDFADKCKVTPQTIYNRIASGELSVVKKGSATFIDLTVSKVFGAKRAGRKSAKEILAQK